MSRIVETLLGRRTGSLLTGLSFAVMSVSGVLSFASAYTERLAGVHTIAGFSFIAAAAIHVVHNGTTWLRYVRGRNVAWPSRSFVGGGPGGIVITARLPLAGSTAAVPRAPPRAGSSPTRAPLPGPAFVR